MRRKILKKMCHLQLLTLLASIAMAAAAGASVHDGTASYYSSPYLPTVCNGDDPSQLPSNSLFAVAGGELWDNGAAYGREYMVRCVNLSRSIPGNCTDDGPIRVKIIDWALSSKSAAAVAVAASKLAGEGGDALVLFETAFKSIAKPFADSINDEYQAPDSMDKMQTQVAAVVIMACNRTDYLERTIKPILKYGKSVL